jgi:AraC family transcriptional regulator, positive regulator of tynA and feaB
MPFWTTQDLPSDKQFGFWREVLCEAFITLNPSRKRRGAFSGSVEANLLSDVNVTRLLTEEHRVLRGARKYERLPLNIISSTCRSKAMYWRSKAGARS